MEELKCNGETIDRGHFMIRRIYLEEDTLTLWKPPENRQQYKLIPEIIPEGDWSGILQTYYTKFDCVTNFLPLDDLIPIISRQSTTLKPTDDYSILRDYPTIKGLWFKPDIDENIGPNMDTTLGNVKLNISLNSSEQENIFTQKNVYFLEVLDYPAEDKSVSRFLLSQSFHEEFQMYNVFKPGGPIIAIRHVGPMHGEIEMLYLRFSKNYYSQRWRHEVEFMLEDDPWPMCKIIPVNNTCLPISISRAEGLDVHVSNRYRNTSWELAIAGLFVWALRARLAWLVFERLHDKAKEEVNMVVRGATNCSTVNPPLICPLVYQVLESLTSFIAKCQNEEDIKDFLKIFVSLHTCSEDCSVTLLTNLDILAVIDSYLFLLEKVIACCSVEVRREITSTILPWHVMAYYCSSQKIHSYNKIIAFISKIEGLKTRSLSYHQVSNGQSDMFTSSSSSSTRLSLMGQAAVGTAILQGNAEMSLDDSQDFSNHDLQGMSNDECHSNGSQDGHSETSINGTADDLDDYDMNYSQSKPVRHKLIRTFV
ncbi:hypothetical protein ACJMK2_004297 [Sinanodonta woodiana]|uniref:Uncharacterized protein n=1 Tax=Sinanodonta woodiana TaxID=1069815 RepID=A0ABD3Y333_SINWO